MLDRKRRVKTTISPPLTFNLKVDFTFSVPSLGETGEGFHNVELCIFEITDPLYLHLKWGGLVCPYLESPLECLVDV